MIFLLTLLAMISDVYAMIYTWTWDADLVYPLSTVENSCWVTNGFWDVKGFQWDDPNNTYPSGFNHRLKLELVLVQIRALIML